MKKYLKTDFVHITFIVVLGLLPFLWIGDGQFVAGHDSGISFGNVVHFLDRLNVWTQRYGLGADQSFALGGFMIHGLDAFVSYLGFSPFVSQRIVLSFWFMVPGLTMYYLGKTISSKRDMGSAWFVASIFYMYNHFILQAWFVAERTKFSLYAALPVLFAIFIRFYRDEVSAFKAAFIISITLLILNGGGFLPLYGSVILAWIVFIALYIYLRRELKAIFHILKLLFYTSIMFVLFNFYWILPYVVDTLQVYTNTVAGVGGISGIKTWIDVISRNATYDNLVRLRGIPEWYQNPYHPYASLFLENPMLVTASYLIPILVWYSVFAYRGRLGKNVLLFGLFGLLSMILTAGSNFPFGFIYVFLVERVPGLAVFRTPFYKFGMGLWFSYSILFGMGIYAIGRKFFKGRSFNIWIGVIAVVVIVYSFPFLDGRFFEFEIDRKTTLTNPPEYVFDFFENVYPKISNSQTRTLILPEHGQGLKIDSYTWGYWSLATLPSVSSNGSFISNASQLSNDERLIVEALYERLREDDDSWRRLAQMLAVDGLLLRKDINWQDEEFGTTSPLVYGQILSGLEGVNHVFESGEWIYYDIADSVDNRIYFSRSAVSTPNGVEDIEHLADLPVENENVVALSFSDLVEAGGDIYVMADCVNCDLIRQTLILPDVKVDAGSKLYPAIRFFERRNLEKLENPVDKAIYLKNLLYKRLANVRVLYAREEDGQRKLFAIGEARSALGELRENLSGAQHEDKMLENNLYSVLGEEASDLSFFLEGLVKNYSIEGKEKDEVDGLISDGLDLLNFLNSRAWTSDSELEKRLLLNIPTSAEYEVLIKRDSMAFLKNDILPRFVEIGIDGEFKKLRIIGHDAKWVKLEPLAFSGGLHKLLLRDTESGNLMDVSREDLRSDENVAINFTGDDQFQVSFAPARDNNCVSAPFPPGLDQKSTYKYGYSYKILDGQQNLTSYVSSIARKNTPDLRSGRNFLAGSIVAKDFENILIPAVGESFLHFCAHDSSVGANFVAEIQHPYIREIKTPVVFATLKGSEELKPDTSLTVIKSSNSKYKVRINTPSPGYLVFADSFNQDWNIDGEFEHIRVNGVLNGWKIPAGDSVTTIEFSPQRVFVYASLVSVISVMVFSFIFYRYEIRQRR